MRRRNPELDKIIGKNMLHIRSARGMSRAELGEALGISRQQIEKYESGKDSLLLTMAVEIATVLETDLSTFIGEETTCAIPLLSKEQANIAALYGELDTVARGAMRTLCAYLTGGARG